MKANQTLKNEDVSNNAKLISFLPSFERQKTAEKAIEALIATQKRPRSQWPNRLELFFFFLYLQMRWSHRLEMIDYDIASL